MSEDRRRRADPGAHRLLERMLNLSDGVFAIVLTLLVLDLRMPPGVTDANLFRGILAMEPRLVAFGLTFALDSLFWIAQASILRRLIVFDWAAAWANLAFLFTIALTPFASTLLGDYSVFGNAWRLYCLLLIAIGAAQTALMLVIYRDGGRLLGDTHRGEFWYRLTRAVSPVAAFSVALTFSLLGWTHVSVFASFVFVPVLLFVARRWLAPKAAPATPLKAARPGAKSPARTRPIKRR
jgi:uncharacterized membrane protein